MINLSEQNSSLEIMNQEDSMFKATETEDHIDRINKSLKAIMQQNQVLEQQILQLRTNPKQFIQPLRNQLIIKINELQKENSQLRRQVEQSKIPVFSEMKRKSFVPNQNFDRDSMKSSNRQSMRSSLNGRGALSQMNSNSNYDKNEIASTCFNEQQRYMQPQQQINPILKLQKPSQAEEAQRERLTHQIRYLIARTQIFEKTMDQLNKKERKQCQKNAQKIKSEESQIAKIQKYKKKLCDLLNKLKHRQIQMDEMVKMYKQLHADTIKKLQESTQALRQLQQEKIDDDIEKKYAEVLQLEERLQIINAELQQMDEQRWLEKALKQLAIVFKRLGIPIPKFESVRGAIDELCQILIEHHLMCKQDNTDKLIKLKQYQEEEKQNNQRLIQALKTKEQILSKKLNNIQIQKGSNTKK